MMQWSVPRSLVSPLQGRKNISWKWCEHPGKPLTFINADIIEKVEDRQRGVWWGKLFR